MGFVECTLPHDKVMNVFFNTMIMLKTNFKKFSGNSKEDTFKSSSTMKVVEQESIKQGNSEQSVQTFNVSQTKKKKKKRKKKYQASAAEPQLKVATLKRS